MVKLGSVNGNKVFLHLQLPNPYFKKRVDSCNLRGYIRSMIKSFSHKGLEDFFYDGVKKGIQTKHAEKIAHILSA